MKNINMSGFRDGHHWPKAHPANLKSDTPPAFIFLELHKGRAKNAI